MDNIAYVTGADRGLGIALVQELLRRSYTVFAGSYLDAHGDLDNLASPQLIVVPLDVTDDGSVNASARIIESSTDHLNLLVNNAGMAVDRSRTIQDTLYFDDMRRIMEVNAFGPLRVAKSVLHLLLRSERKTIVNISSIAGSIGTITRNTQYAYAMSKASLNMQSKLIRNHFGPDGLIVLVVHPGAMPTLILGDARITKDAPVATSESAVGILNLVDRDWAADDGFFVDHLGNPIPW